MIFKIVSMFVVILFSFLSFGNVVNECDPENAARFIKVCGSSSNQSSAGVQMRSLWQGTDHPGYQLLDCKNGTIKNVIESSGESYSCRMVQKHFDAKKTKATIGTTPDIETYYPKMNDSLKSNPAKPSSASPQ